MEAMKKFVMPFFVIVGLLAIVGCTAGQSTRTIEVTREVPVEAEAEAEAVAEVDSAESTESSELSEPSQPAPVLLTDEYEIVTLLPKDAIPSIDNPEFLTAVEAGEEYAPDELVMGVDFNGERRAYSTSLLSSHEIVNDVVGGKNIAVTW